MEIKFNNHLNRAIYKIVLITLFLISPAFCKSTLVFFPLKQDGGDTLDNWLGYVIPDIFYRNTIHESGLQSLDPVFINTVAETKNLISNLKSDSLLFIHKERWKWDYAIGGTFTVQKRKNVTFNLEIISLIDEKITRKTIHKIVSIDSITTRIGPLFYEILKKQLWLDFEYKTDAMDNLKNIRKKNINKNAYAVYAKGFGYEIIGHKDKAVSSYNMSLMIDPEFIPALLRLGRLYMLSKEYTTATEILSKAYLISPNIPMVVAEYTKLQVINETPDVVLKFIKQNRKLLEKSAVGLTAMGLFYLNEGSYSRAISDLTKAVVYGTPDLEALFTLGRAYINSGDYTRAIDIFMQLIALKPENIGFYSFLGEAYRRAGKLMSSVNVLENAYLFEPDNITNLLNLSSTYIDLGWYNKAGVILARILELDSDMSGALLNFGVLNQYSGNYKKAEEYFKKAAFDESKKMKAMANLANIYLLSGDAKTAIKIYKKAAKIGLNRSEIDFNMGLAYLSTGKIKEAEIAFERILEFYPDRIQVLKKLSMIASLRGDEYKSELYLRKMLMLEPNDKGLKEDLIVLLNRTAQYEEAGKVIDEYLLHYPQNREYRLMQLDIYRKIGWIDVAISRYNDLLKEGNYSKDADVYIGRVQCQIAKFKKNKSHAYDRAIYDLKIALENSPNNPIVDLLLGVIYRDYKKYNLMAKEFFESAYKKSTDTKEKAKIIDLMNGAIYE